MKKIIAFFLLTSLLLSAKTIKEIKFDRKDLYPLLPFKAGDEISPALIREAVVNLYKTGLFYNVEVKAIDKNNDVIIFIKTTPAKFFGKVKIKGKIGIKKRRLKKLCREFYPFKEQFREKKLNEFLKTIKVKFAELGFPDAKITCLLKTEKNTVYPEITINCGKPLIVRSIKTNNLKLYKKFIKIKKGHVYNKELFTHGIKKLKAYLLKMHYLNSKIDYKESVKGKDVFLEVSIEKGKKFEIRSKNLKIDKTESEDICAFLKRGKINNATIKITEKNLYFKALKMGYADPEIKIEIDKNHLFCSINHPVKKEIKSVQLNSPIPLKLTKKIRFFNKLTKSNIYSTLSSQLSAKGYLRPSIRFEYDDQLHKLTVNVRPGKRYIVGKIKIVSDVPLSKELINSLIKEGETFNKDKLTHSIEVLKTYLAGEGYFNPSVNITITKAEDNLIPVKIMVAAGKKKKIEDIVIIGNRNIKKEDILKFADFKKGETINKTEIENFINKLEFSGLFTSAKADIIDRKNGNSILLLKLKENRLYTFSYAIGVNSDEGLRFTAKIKKRYLFKTFLTGTTIVRVSSKRKQGYFTINGEKHFLSSLYFTLEDRDDYRFSRYGFSVSYRGNIFSHLRYIESIEFTKNNLTNLRVPLKEIKKELQPDYTIGLKTNILYDRRNNVLFPEKGFFVNTTIFPAYVVNDDRFFLKTSLKFGFYFNNLEIISRIGKIFTRDNYEIPLPQRFFIGGSTNLRISSFEKAGPLFSTGVPKGGNFLFVVSAEYKHHLKDVYYLTLFTDIGNVWEDSSDFSFDSCVKDAGVGVLIKTPVGPMKIQIATNLDKGTFPSRYKLVFSFGTTF